MSLLIGTLALVAVLGADNPDGVVATARGSQGSVPVADTPIEVVSPSLTVSDAAQGLSTAQQIDRWIGERPDTAEPPVWRHVEPRRMTGEVNLGIGTGDYSHLSGHVTLPLGETGQLSLGFSQTKNGWYERPMGVDGLFWDPHDAWLGPQWVTPSGRSYSPLDHDRTRISRQIAPASRD